MLWMSQYFTRNYKTAEADESIDICTHRSLFLAGYGDQISHSCLLLDLCYFWPNYVLILVLYHAFIKDLQQTGVCGVLTCLSV